MSLRSKYLIGIAIVSIGLGTLAYAGDIYYCPMHPNYTSDRPGDCPICYMKLVKREPSETKVSQKSVAKQLNDICILHNCAKAHKGKLCPMMVIGKEGEQRVDCPICGKHIIEDGKVKKVLYWTDPMIPDFKSDQPGKSPMGMELVPVYEEIQAVPTAVVPEGYAPILLTPQKQKMIGVKNADVQKRVLTKTIRTGATIDRAERPVVVYAFIYEYELPLIRVGQKLKAEVPVLPGQVFGGTIKGLNRKIADKEIRTASIRVQLQDPQNRLKLNMFANLTINVDLGEVLAVPKEAVFDTGVKKIVYIDQGDGLFEPRDVVLGAMVDDYYEVKSGLQEGDKVVVSGNFLIDSESRLKASLESMGSGGGHIHGQ